MKTRWITWIIAVLPLIIIVGFIYVTFYGNPIGRVIARIEFEQYLSRNFSQSIEIDNVKYEFKFGHYFFANVHVKKNKNLQFQVWYEDKKIVDDYFASSWEQDIKNKLGSEVATIFNHKATLDFVDIYSESLLKFHFRGDKIPNYFTYQKELSSSRLSDLASSTNLDVEFSYDYKNNQSENQKLYKLITLIKKEIPCETINLTYKSNVFPLDPQQISSFEDIPKYMK